MRSRAIFNSASAIRFMRIDGNNLLVASFFTVLAPGLILGSVKGYGYAPITLQILSVVPVVVVSGIIYALFVWTRTYVDIYPNRISIKNGTQNADLELEEIKNYDVQSWGAQFYVVMWHGPIPLYTVSNPNPQNATALKEGILIAIRLVNQLEPKGPFAAPRRFPE